MPVGVSPVTGMMTPQHVLLRRGLIALLVTVLVAAAYLGVRAITTTAPTAVTLVVRSVAPGVGSGTAVEMDGLRVGRVTDITDRGNGKLGIDIELNGTADDLVTDAVKVNFASGNTFGITAVTLTPGKGGRALVSGAVWEPVNTPDDATMSTLIRSLSKMEREGFRPHMSELISQLDTTTKQFLPFAGALGALAEANADTQVVPTAQTLPTIAATLASLDGSMRTILPAVRKLWEWNGPDLPGYPERQRATIDMFVTDMLPKTTHLFSEPNVAALAEVLVPIRELSVRMTESFPDAARNGRQIEELIERIRRSMPDTGNGPVLNLNVAFAQFPAIADVLPPMPTFTVTPRGAKKPTAPSSTAPKPTRSAEPAPSTPGGR